MSSQGVGKGMKPTVAQIGIHFFEGGANEKFVKSP